MYTHIITYFRLRERCRWLWNACWDYTRDQAKNLLVAPVDLITAMDTFPSSLDGNIKYLCNPRNVLSSNLHVHLIRLPPGREMTSRKAPGVEFYLCLAGTGEFSQRGLDGTVALRKGDGVVVDAGNVRWISNGSGREDLWLVRTADVASSKEPMRLDPATRKTTLKMIQNNFHQVKTLAREYAQTAI